ncbi:GNAT family N-acetyltransferase [Amycolatopsis speibonae]|uniref:GNAT family N-acetyltransferase n=1 Tax=Amycolatopsis speibonae TaxID=1450224 RepID=A0ABV7NZ69_9PSEU
MHHSRRLLGNPDPWQGRVFRDRTQRRRLRTDTGVAAGLDGRLVGVAHYLFHASIRYSGKRHLADLFVDPRVRRRGTRFPQPLLEHP